VHLTLAAIAKFSVRMLWVVGFLFVADFGAIILIVLRTGKVDQDEGCVVTKQGTVTGNALNRTGSGVNFLGVSKYWGKEKILVHRSEFISDKSLVDGTATKSQRLLVHCAQLAFVLFWLLFVFIGLSLLPTGPIGGAIFIILSTFGFSKAGMGMHRGRVEAPRKVTMKREKAAKRLEGKHEN